MPPLTLEHKHGKFHIGHSFMAIGVFMFLLLSIFLGTLPTQSAYAFGTNDIAVLSNQERTNNSVAPLNTNAKLTSAAQAKADHMVNNNYFEHTAPDGTTGWYFIGLQDYSYSVAGENLAASNQGAYAMVSGPDGWINSPGHRANLLNPEFSDVGYGIAYQGVFERDGQTYQDVYFVVALYAKPAYQQPVAAPETSAPASNNTPASPNESEPVETGSIPTPTLPTSSVKPIALNVNPTPIALEATTSLSGTSTQLSKGRLKLSSDAILAIASISGALVITGIVIDLIRLSKRGAGIHTFHHR